MIRVVLAAAVLLTISCGSVSAAPVAPTSPSNGFGVLVTDNDRAVNVHPGQKIELVLHAKPGMSNWSNVMVDDPSVLRGVPTGITAAMGVTIAGFEAVSPGTAKITATAVPVCSPGQACPAIAMLYELTVTVS